MPNLIARLDGQMKRQVLDRDLASMTVQQLRSEAAKLAALHEDKINLLYAGKLLKDDASTLSSLGVKSTSNIHVLKKPEENKVAAMEPKELSDADVRQIYLAFGMALRDSKLSVALKRLTERENLDSLAAACPGLANDPLALSLLSKPEMLLVLLKPDVLKKVAKEHPSLCEALSNLAAAVHEEKTNIAGTSAEDGEERIAAAFDYHLDDIQHDGEDEDDDMDNYMETNEGIQRDRSFSAITPEQLSAAIAAATAQSSLGGGTEGGAGGGIFQGMTGMGPSSSSAMTEPSTSSTSSSQPGGISSARSAGITADMFRAAMEQAMAAASSSSGAAGPGAASGNTQNSTSNDSFEKNVRTMRDMGISDEELARKALTLMEGDVQAAIDLIFSGWIGEDDSLN